ncbi:MAG TPA: glycosyltransferase family 39 protein [Gemmatimonadaceae bacterium]
MPDLTTPESTSGRRRWILAALFVLGLAVRLVDLDSPGVLVDRDYTSAMFARHYYFDGRTDVAEWRRTIAAEQVARQPILEPPVTEWIASLAYRVAGRDDIRLGRLVTITFWMIGGWFFFLLARRLTGEHAAFIAVAYYLFTPAAVLLSRSFQADALMMLLFIASLLAIVRHHEAPSRWTLAVAAIVSALTLVYRPLVMPAVVLAFVLPVVQAAGWKRGLFGRPSLIFVLAATAPALAYYGYGSFVARYFQWKLTSSFMFSLYGHREFWREWFLIALSELGVTFLILAILGVALLARGLARTIVVALGLGYLVFGLAFTYHIHTHGYYQAQALVAVGLAAAPAVLLLARRANEDRSRWVRLLPFVGAIVLAGSWWSEWRSRMSVTRMEPPAVAQEIGELVRHSDRVVFLSPYYGLALQYLGEFTGQYWPRGSTYWLYRPAGERPRTLTERMGALPFEPEYFVITHFPEYAANHADLRQYLESNCLPVAMTAQYHIYGSCRKPGS